MPSYLDSTVVDWKWTELTFGEQVAILPYIDEDTSDHTVETFSRALETASRAAPRVTIEALVHEGDYDAHTLVRATAGVSTSVHFEYAEDADDDDENDDGDDDRPQRTPVRASTGLATDLQRFTELRATSTAGLLPPKLLERRLRLGFPQSIAAAIVEHRIAGRSQSALVETLWVRAAPKLSRLARAEVEAVLGSTAAEPVVAEVFSIAPVVQHQMRHVAERLGLKISNLMTYAWLTEPVS